MLISAHHLLFPASVPDDFSTPTPSGNSVDGPLQTSSTPAGATRVSLSPDGLAHSRGDVVGVSVPPAPELYDAGEVNRVATQGVSSMDLQPAARVELKARLLQEYPLLHDEAKHAIESRLLKDHGVKVDADRTWFHMFGGAQDSAAAYSGWAHEEAPLRSLSLTDLQIRNFSADFAQVDSDLNAFSGIYTEDAGGTSYGAHNEVKLHTTDVQQAIWANDFYHSYLDKLSAYWDRNVGAQAVVFEQNALQFASNHSLSEQALTMLSEAAGLAPGHSGLERQGTVAHVFDIDSYPSRDMTWLQASDGHVVLLMPGAAQSIREYTDVNEMRQDIAAMTRTQQGRAELARHFSLYNLEDGVTYQGVRKWLDDIAGGGYDQRIAYAPTEISGSIFKNQAKRVRDASLDDVTRLVRSNNEVTEEEVIQAFGAVNKVMGNYATQLIELGLNVHMAVTAGSPDARRQAVMRSWGNAASLALSVALEGMGRGARIGPASALGRSSFTPPVRLADGRIGYLMGPTRAPSALNAAWDASMEAVLQGGHDHGFSEAGVDITPLPPPEFNRRAYTPFSTRSSPSTVSESSPPSSTFSSPVPRAFGVSPSLGLRDLEPELNVENTTPAIVSWPNDSAYFNSRGMIERRDLACVYRAESLGSVRHQNPELNGFRNSRDFQGIPQMLDGDVLITARTEAGARAFADPFGHGGYAYYEIDVSGLRTVSLRENVEFNPQFTSLRQTGREDTIERSIRDGTLNQFGEGAYAFDEVHVDNTDLEPVRIRKIG